LESLGGRDFAWAALFSAALANAFAAFRDTGNKQFVETEGLKDRMDGVGNQFALKMINSFLFYLVLILITKGH